MSKLANRMRSTRRSRKRGSALVVVLWLVGILSMLVTTMAFEAHLQAKISSHSRKKLKATHMVKSGVEMAEMLMRKSNDITAKKLDEAEDDDDVWSDLAKQLSAGGKVSMTDEFAGGVVSVEISPEPALRNVNLLTEEDWERVLEVGEVPLELWPTLIESLQDWKDRDNEARRDGAETDDYYSTLDKPYRAKNGPLDTVEELLLVKGFSRAVLSGGPLPRENENEDPIYVKGIGHLLTIYGDGKVNVNAATHEVLMTLPGLDDIAAGAIIEERDGLLLEESEREDTSFENVGDLFRRLPEIDPIARNQMVTASKIYRLTSTADVGGVTRTVRCVGSFTGDRFDVLRWWEQD